MTVRRTTSGLILTTLAVSLGVSSGVTLGFQPVPPAGAVRIDPDTVDVTLDNGLRVIVRRRVQPDAWGDPGETAFWLRLEAGSAYERDDERGAAHVAEHLSLSGPEPGQPGFEATAALGVPFGKMRNGYTNIDHAAYWVVTDGSTQQNGAAMQTLAAMLNPGPVNPKRFATELDTVVQEWNESDSPETRAQRALLAGLYPGTSLDTRWPSVEPEKLKTLTPEIVDRFRARTSTPNGATLIVVGPVDPGHVIALANQVFGGLEPGPRAEPVRQRGPLWPGDRGLRTVRAEEDGLSETEITIAWPGRTTGDTLDADSLAEMLAVTVLRERVKRMVAQTPDWTGTDLMVSDQTLPSAERDDEDGDPARLRLTQIAARFPPAEASKGLSTMALAVSGMTQNPVTETELSVASESVLSRYERAAKADSSRSAREIASGISLRLPGKLPEPIDARLAKARELLREIRAERVTSAARTLFDPREAVLLAQGPTGKLPGSSAMLADLRLALFAPPGPSGFPQIDAPETEPRIFVERPREAEVQRVSLDPSAGVFDAVLDNGVIVRHRAMPTTEGEVLLRVSLLDVEQNETEETRGLASAAAEALAKHPATRASSADELSWFMERHGISLDARTAEGPIDLLVRTPSDSLDTGAMIVAALLTEPSVGETDLERWKARTIAEFDETHAEPARLAREELLKRLTLTHGSPAPKGQAVSVRGADPRSALLDRLDTYTPVDTGAALVEAAGRSRIVVTVVGACSSEEAVGAVRGAFGALPSVPTARTATPPIGVPGGTFRASLHAGQPGDEAATALAWRLPRELSTQEVRSLLVASHVLDERLAAIEGMGESLRFSQRATLAFDTAAPGWASVVVLFTGEPDRMTALRARVNDVVRDFASQGPTAEELERARARSSGMSRRALDSAWFWSSRLAACEQSGQPLDEVLAMPSDYAGVSAETCRLLTSEALTGGSVVIEVSPRDR